MNSVCTVGIRQLEIIYEQMSFRSCEVKKKLKTPFQCRHFVSLWCHNTPRTLISSQHATNHNSCHHQSGETQAWRVVSLFKRSLCPQKPSKWMGDWERSRQPPQPSLSNERGSPHHHNEEAFIKFHFGVCFFSVWAFATDIWKTGLSHILSECYYYYLNLTSLTSRLGALCL